MWDENAKNTIDQSNAILAMKNYYHIWLPGTDLIWKWIAVNNDSLKPISLFLYQLFSENLFSILLFIKIGTLLQQSHFRNYEWILNHILIEWSQFCLLFMMCQMQESESKVKYTIIGHNMSFFYIYIYFHCRCFCIFILFNLVHFWDMLHILSYINSSCLLHLFCYSNKVHFAALLSTNFQ